jgi:hypothetical protein
VLTLQRNSTYIEKGSPENASPYTGTTIKLPATVREKPVTNVTPRLEPVQRPYPVAPTPATAPTAPAITQLTTPAARPSAAPRAADFSVSGAPKEPTRSLALPDRVAALASFVESHQSPNATNVNHWLYEHAYVLAGARFGWWHGTEALEALIAVDKRAEALWGVGSQSRTTAEKALSEVRARRW